MNKTSGIPGIRCDILKLALLELLTQMTWLYQLTFENGIFPDCWKTARVNPIPKHGNVKMITNWRPISLLPVQSKIAEKLMHIYLTEVLDNAGTLSDRQFGYRSGRGTGDAIFSFLNDIYEGRDRGHLTGACFLDLKKAFDSVHHSYLIEILGRLGLHNASLNWLMSYLTGRQQYTKMGKFVSSVSGVEYGVPQGSVLGPLLFILYINDIENIAGDCKFYLYADDLVLYTSSNKVDTIVRRLQASIDNIGRWCCEKRLTVNTDKTKVAWFGTTQKLVACKNIDYTLLGKPLETVDSYPYLGLKLDSTLSFEPAIKDLCCKVNHRLFRLGAMRIICQRMYVLGFISPQF